MLVVLRGNGTSKTVYISRKALGSMLENGGGWSGFIQTLSFFSEMQSTDCLNRMS